jgi:hypothetical protein
MVIDRFRHHVTCAWSDWDFDPRVAHHTFSAARSRFVPPEFRKALSGFISQPVYRAYHQKVPTEQRDDHWDEIIIDWVHVGDDFYLCFFLYRWGFAEGVGDPSWDNRNNGHGVFDTHFKKQSKLINHLFTLKSFYYGRSSFFNATYR